LVAKCLYLLADIRLPATAAPHTLCIECKPLHMFSQKNYLIFLRFYPRKSVFISVISGEVFAFPIRAHPRQSAVSCCFSDHPITDFP
jgi:hypothetical protein